MSNEIKRVYKGTDAEMLTAIAAIIDAAIENQSILVAKRSSWADPFLPDLQTQINTVTQKFLGADNVKDLRKATQVVEAVQSDAVDSLEEVKVQIERDFRNDKPARNEMLKELGQIILKTPPKKIRVHWCSCLCALSNPLHRVYRHN